MNSSILPPPPDNLEGHLLLSSPMLSGTIFERSCILITEKNDEGHEGFILNQKTKEKVGDLVSEAKDTRLGELPVYLGGPVKADCMHFITLSKQNGKFSFSANISIKHAIFCLDEDDTIVLPCLCYSGWTKGQLEQEFEHFTWFHRKASNSLISKKLDVRTWMRQLSSISPYHKLIARTPEKSDYN